jgi:hypothetical protein
MPPESPLLYVPSHPARTFKRDLDAAAIPQFTPQGKVDFHACRVAYINLLIESGNITPKEVQSLARHASLDLTMNTYGRVREERLADTVGRIGAVVSSVERVPAEYRQAAGSQLKIATPIKTESYDINKLAPAVGLEPTTRWLTATCSTS